MFHMIFSKITDVFVLVSAKFKCQILIQGIFDVSNSDIYHAETIGKKSFLIQLHIFLYD